MPLTTPLSFGEGLGVRLLIIMDKQKWSTIINAVMTAISAIIATLFFGSCAGMI